MKKSLIAALLFSAFAIQAQTIEQWLALDPIKVKQPAFGEIKNVKDKEFKESMLSEYNALNIQNLRPELNHNETKQLKWNNATVVSDTVEVDANTSNALYHYASYFDNKDWISGKFVFTLKAPAEVYIDGEKKITYTDYKTTEKEIKGEWLPRKHTIVVKSISKGGKAFAAKFVADKDFEADVVDFSVSPKRGKNIYDVLNGKSISNIDMSPSGKYAVVSINNTVNGKSSYNTYVYNVENKNIVYTFYGSVVKSLKWMPKLDKLSYMMSEGAGMSLYSYDVETQTIECLIKEDTKIKSVTWAPDCSYILYGDAEDYSHKNWELRKLDGIQDRHEYHRKRIFICKYDFATGLHSRLIWGNLSTSLMDISNSGDKIIFSTSKRAYTEYPFSKQSIYMLNLNTMQVDTLWKDRQFSISVSFSPDDKKLLAQGGASAFGKIGENIGKKQMVNNYDSQLYIYDLATKAVDPITKHFNPSISSAYWHKNGNIYIKAEDADFVRLFKYSEGEISHINCKGDEVWATSFSDTEKMMYTSSQTNYPIRAYTLNLDTEKEMEWMNTYKEQYKNVVFGEMKDWDYQYNKNTNIDGRYYLPADFDPSKKYPLIVYYYGGTSPVSRTFGGRWPFNLYTANGYVVYVMQPSGATGYGQEFAARHQNNWAKITADEIIESTKAFVANHTFIDAAKVGCMGASYGGFTTMYLTTQTDIFACAISHAGISSITSYWGEGNWGYGYNTNSAGHSYPWNRKDIYVEQSPLYNADKVEVPILLIHGTKDVNVPVGESIQFYTALKLLGKDAELVYVKDADHSVVDYNQRIMWNNTILSYFAKYLKNKDAWWKATYKDLNL